MNTLYRRLKWMRIWRGFVTLLFVLAALTPMQNQQVSADAIQPKALANSASKVPTAAKEEEPLFVDTKKVTGTVSGISKRSIGVEYEQTAGSSMEMLLPFSEGMKLDRIKSLSQLAQGDTIEVLFQQTYRKDPEGNRVILKTEAKKITFVKKKPAGLTSTGGSEE